MYGPATVVGPHPARPQVYHAIQLFSGSDMSYSLNS